MYALSIQQIRFLVKIISDNSNIKEQRLFCFRTNKLTQLGFILVLTFLTNTTEYIIHKYVKGL